MKRSFVVLVIIFVLLLIHVIAQEVVKFEHGLQMTKPKPVDTIVEIAGCEYVLKYYPGAYQGYMLFSHKGNCKYCEARFRDTIRQVVSEALANQTAEAAK